MKQKINILFFVAVLFAVASCSEEYMVDTGSIKNKEADIILRLKTPGGYISPKTRSLDYADENTIDDIYVLVFDKDNNLAGIKQGQDVSSAPGNSDPAFSGTGSFTVTLEASKTLVDTYKLLVLANCAGILGARSIGDSDIGSDYNSVTAKIWGEITAPMYTAPGGRIPMWGETAQIVIQPGTGSSQSISLTRAIARIDVGVGMPSKIAQEYSWNGLDKDGAHIPFELTAVYVIRPNNRYAVVPNPLATVGDATTPAGTTKFTFAESESNFAFATPLGYTTRSLYIPESDIVMDDTGKPGDANHTARMAIVVGGKYNGSGAETYYRLDFAKTGSLMNVLRNHLYQFNISRVLGAGYPDVETAYNSLAMNMTVDIHEWNEKEITDIVMDGQYYFGISRSKIELSKDAQLTTSTDNKIIVTTDYPAGWSLRATEDGGGIVNALNEPVDWLSISPSTGAPGAPTSISLIASENVTGEDRTAYIYFKAGRLNYKVEVMQLSIRRAFFSVLWEKSVVSGVYNSLTSTPLDNTNTITLKVHVSDPGVYHVTTNTVDGISFSSGEKEFTEAGEQTITLTGTGIPVKTITKNMTVDPQTGAPTGTVKVYMTLPEKRILSLGLSGWAIHSTAGIANMFKSDRNYGTQLYSTYKAVRPVVANPDFISGTISGAKLASYLEPGGIGSAPNVDIVVMCYDSNLSDAAAPVMERFVKKGGVLVMLNEHIYLSANLSLITSLIGSVAYTLDTAVPAGAILQLPTTANDQILNGPFGDLRGKYIGEDNGSADAIVGIDSSKLDWWVSSVDHSGTAGGSQDQVFAFKAKDYNFFWCGDGGMPSYYSGYEDSRLQYPALLTASPDYEPMAKLYGRNGASLKYVENSRFFANILAWAIQQAEFNGIE